MADKNLSETLTEEDVAFVTEFANAYIDALQEWPPQDESGGERSGQL